MFYGLLTGRIPPIANYQEKDPELGDLNLSKGGDHSNLKYGMRFGAGFGSQIALSFVRKWDINGDRINGQKLLTWCKQLANSDEVELRILDGKLVSYVDGSNNLHGGIQGDEWVIIANQNLQKGRRRNPERGNPRMSGHIPSSIVCSAAQNFSMPSLSH